MKKLALYILLTSFSGVFAQDSSWVSPPAKKAPSSFRDRIFFGGNMGLQFGSITFVDVSPLVGYKITPKLHAGLGATYMYYSYNIPPDKFNTDVYGGRIFGRYFFLDNLFGHAEYEVLNLEVIDFGLRERTYVENMFVGGGYNQPLGGNAYISLLVLYNLNESARSPYSNPIIRMGVGFGI